MIKWASALVAVALVSAGCTVLPSKSQNISEATKLNSIQLVSAQQAHAVCTEYGAAPGTRMFYDCMKDQAGAAEYQVALANCKADQYSRQVKLECLRGGSGLFGLRSCLRTKEQTCETNARLSYLPDSAALKIETTDHEYLHTYNHAYSGTDVK